LTKHACSKCSNKRRWRSKSLKRFVAVLIAWGSFGLFLLAIADSAGVPLVAGVDALLIAIAQNDPAQAYGAALAAVLGSLIGSSFLFALARKGGEVWLKKHISHGNGARLHRWFERYGLLTVFIPALCPIPLPMKIPVFCAGALEVRWTSFLGVLLPARVIRYFALAFLAQRYGHDTFSFLKHHWGAVAAFAGSLAVLVLLVLRLLNRRRGASA
jgi:membrane protein YqaA with SNARE-associated domain